MHPADHRRVAKAGRAETRQDLLRAACIAGHQQSAAGLGIGRQVALPGFHPGVEAHSIAAACQVAADGAGADALFREGYCSGHDRQGAGGDCGAQARATAQLDKWRAVAGFKGTSTEMQFDDRGKILWLIDLEPSGKVILHVAGRTFHGSLKGATVNGFGSELEVAVRDEYWTEDDPRLAAYRILGGSKPEIRRAWKERLDLMIQNLGGDSGHPPQR